MNETLLKTEKRGKEIKKRNFKPGLKMSNVERIIESLIFIEWNMTEDIDAEIISKEVGYSVKYFRKLFKRVTGFGVERYIYQRRLAEVTKKLTEKPDNLFKLVNEYRFSHYRSFSNVFTRQFHVKPIDIRTGQSLKKFPLQEAIINHIIEKNDLN